MHRNTWSIYTYCISIEWEETRQISTAFYQTKENKTLSLIVRGRMAKATCDNQSFLIESSQVLLYFHLHFHLQLSELVHMKNSKTNEISKQQKSKRKKKINKRNSTILQILASSFERLFSLVTNNCSFQKALTHYPEYFKWINQASERKSCWNSVWLLMLSMDIDIKRTNELKNIQNWRKIFRSRQTSWLFL